MAKRPGADPPAGPPPPRPQRAPTPEPPTAAPARTAHRGLAASMWAMTRRKMRELRGRQWEDKAIRDRDKQAKLQARKEREAAKLARKAIADRIEAETGWRPSDRTMRRHIAAGTVPRGVDEAKMERQAVIDNAGSIARLARSRGTTAAAITKWRDNGGHLPEEIPESLLVTLKVMATLYCKGERYKEDQVYSVDVSIEGERVAPLLQAAKTGDYSGIVEIAGQLAVDNFNWVGAADRSFIDVEVLDVSIGK